MSNDKKKSVEEKPVLTTEESVLENIEFVRGLTPEEKEDWKQIELNRLQVVQGLTAEERALDVQLKKLELVDRQEAARKRYAEREQKRIQAESRNKATLAQMAQQVAREENCTHRKGGMGPNAVLNGQGDDALYYAVIKHKLPAGKYFVLCTRCLKEWHPADPISGTPETPGYKQALMFPTNNSASGSSTFLFKKDTTGEILNSPDRAILK
jgi:hypothetical protein